MAVPTRQQFEDGKVDLDTLEGIVNHGSSDIVTRRGEVVPTYTKSLEQLIVPIDEEVSLVQSETGMSQSGFNQALNLPQLTTPMFHGFLRSRFGFIGSGGSDYGISHQRVSAKTFLEANGLIDVANPEKETPSPWGWEFSPPATNSLLYSGQFDNSSWLKQDNSTIDPNAAVSPDGSISADKLIEGLGTQAHRVYQFLSTQIGDPYTLSCFAKAAEKDYLVLNSNASGKAYFNLKLGYVGVVVNGTAGMVALPNGWYFCYVTDNASVSAATVWVQVADSDGVEVYSGDGLSGIYLWAAQLEQHPFPTPHIATSASAVTRQKDVVALSDVNHPEVASGQPLSISMVLKIDGPPDGSYADILSANGPAYSFFRLFQDGDLRYYRNASGLGLVNVTWGEPIHIAVTVDENNFTRNYVNGELVSSGTMIPFSRALPTSFNVYPPVNGEDLNMHLQDLRIYDVKLEEDEIKFLHGV